MGEKLIAKIRAAVPEHIGWQNTLPRITQPLEMFLPHQTRGLGARVPVMQAVPGARRSIGPAKRLENGQLLQHRYSGGTGRGCENPRGCPIRRAEMVLIGLHLARTVVGHVRVSDQTAIGLHRGDDVRGDVARIKHLIRIVNAVRVGLTIGAHIPVAVGI